MFFCVIQQSPALFQLCYVVLTNIILLVLLIK